MIYKEPMFVVIDYTEADPEHLMPDISGVMERKEILEYFQALGASWLHLENVDTKKPVYEQAGIRYFVNHA